MYRTHHCGELRSINIGDTVTLSGWVQKIRDKGAIIWIDLRDCYGITQVVIKEELHPRLLQKVRSLGREFVIQVKGKVIPRFSINKQLPTGEIEIDINALKLINASKIPPFVIDKETDGGEELRMKYRYLDLRRSNMQHNIILRSRLAQEVRNYLSKEGFIDIETPVLIKSTPEGARDFVVPSRMNQGEFYALPQSPQTFKQILMISGFDKYYQIVKCFRDEDLRADRQPEFTQIDCEMSFVELEDILKTFEEFIRHLFKVIKQVSFDVIPRITFHNAIKHYGTDKPDIRFGMQISNLTSLARGFDFQVFDNSEVVLAINAKGCAHYSRKQIDALTDWVKRPQIDAKGLVYVKCLEEQTYKSSVDKFFNPSIFQKWCQHMGDVEAGDLLLLLSGGGNTTYKQMGELRLHLGKTLKLYPHGDFKPIWVTQFPLLEWDDESQRYHAMHHPFTSPMEEDIPLLEDSPEKVRAQAYDMVINGVEIGGGSIRIHNRLLQQKMFNALGFTPEDSKKQFGFLLDAFEYGAPPHGGIAFGFDRMCSLFENKDSIRDFIAFPKNNSGKDVMIDAPACLNQETLIELGLKT